MAVVDVGHAGRRFVSRLPASKEEEEEEVLLAA